MNLPTSQSHPPDAKRKEMDAISDATRMSPEQLESTNRE